MSIHKRIVEQKNTQKNNVKMSTTWFLRGIQDFVGFTYVFTRFLHISHRIMLWLLCNHYFSNLIFFTFIILILLKIAPVFRVMPCLSLSKCSYYEKYLIKTRVTWEIFIVYARIEMKCQRKICSALVLDENWMKWDV